MKTFKITDDFFTGVILGMIFTCLFQICVIIYALNNDGKETGTDNLEEQGVQLGN